MKRALIFLAACGGHGAPAAAPTSTPTCEQSFTITSQEELDALGRCVHVQGDVTIRGGAALDLRAIAGVETISGTLMIGPTFDLDVVGIDGLREVHDLRILSNGLAGGVYLPKLQAVSGTIEIAANVSIAQVALPAIETVHGDLVIEQNPSLELIDLGVLVQVDGMLQLRNDPLLKMVEIGTLQHAGGVDLTGSAIPEDHPLRAHAEKSD